MEGDQGSGAKAVWDLAIPTLEVTDQLKIQYHYAFLSTCIRTLLSNLSLLPSKEFYDSFDALYTKQNLGHKGLIINTYQKVYSEEQLTFHGMFHITRIDIRVSCETYKFIIVYVYSIILYANVFDKNLRSTQKDSKINISSPKFLPRKLRQQ